MANSLFGTNESFDWVDIQEYGQKVQLSTCFVPSSIEPISGNNGTMLEPIKSINNFVNQAIVEKSQYI